MVLGSEPRSSREPRVANREAEMLLSVLTAMTLVMVTTVAAVMARADAPTPAPVRKQGVRIRMTR